MALRGPSRPLARRSSSLDPRIFDELNRRLAEAADRIRALASAGDEAESGPIAEARRGIASAAGFAGLLADRERLHVLRDAEEALIDRLGRDPTMTLLGGAVGLAAVFSPGLSCGLLIDGSVAVSDGWDGPFRAWHERPGIGPRRCPLLAVGPATASVRVDRIDAAESWPEWRSIALAGGRHAAMALSVTAGQRTLLAYSWSQAISDAEIEAVRRIARLAARILEYTPPTGPEWGKS